MRARVVMVSALVGMMAACALGGAEPEAPATECPFGRKSDPNSPIAITLTLKSRDAAEGIKAHVEIVNRHESPFVLHTCSGQHLCCVKDLHPMLAYDGTGIGLTDFCKEAKPTSQEVVLQPGKSYAFELQIPAQRIPANAGKTGKKPCLFLSYQLTTNTAVYSNVVAADLP